jgi:hypothetical protein
MVRRRIAKPRNPDKFRQCQAEHHDVILAATAFIVTLTGELSCASANPQKTKNNLLATLSPLAGGLPEYLPKV